MLSKENFDIIHYHEPMIPLLAGQILSRSKAINVATFHAYRPDALASKSLNLIHLPYHRNRVKYINYITAVSDAAAIFLRKGSKADITIVPNGIELARYNPDTVKSYQEFDDDVKTILYIGRLEKRKGVDYLLRAYEEIKSWESSTKVRLVIAGDGPKMRSLKNYVAQFAIEDVHFLGFVSEDDKLSLLKTCDVFCSPAIYGESFGIVLLEAMAMGAPIVAGDNPGYASVMKETGRISLVNPKHLDDFVNRLQILIEEDRITDVFRDWAKNYVKQFDYKIVTDKYLDIYQKLLDDEKA